jgi:hypothetical protein
MSHALAPMTNADRPRVDWEAGFQALLDAHLASLATPLLTEAGLAFIQQQLQLLRSVAVRLSVPTAPTPALPRWDAKHRLLWLGTRLLKKFRRDAVNQMLILGVFEEEHWPLQSIVPSLEPQLDGDIASAQGRLQDTLKNLNRDLPPGTIRFVGDGSGQGIRWERNRGKSRGRKK